VRVNFGVFAGRGATPAEIDELAAALLPKVGDVSIVAEERHEIGEDAEASLNQVRIEVSPDHVPDDERELDILCGRLVEAAESWARGCIPALMSLFLVDDTDGRILAELETLGDALP